MRPGHSANAPGSMSADIGRRRKCPRLHAAFSMWSATALHGTATRSSPMEDLPARAILWDERLVSNGGDVAASFGATICTSRRSLPPGIPSGLYRRSCDPNSPPYLPTPLPTLPRSGEGRWEAGMGREGAWKRKARLAPLFKPPTINIPTPPAPLPPPDPIRSIGAMEAARLRPPPRVRSSTILPTSPISADRPQPAP